MFKTFFVSEFKYVLKQPAIYIYIIIFALLEFFSLANQNATAGLIYRNAPFTITRQILQLIFMSLIIMVHFFNNAALRDYKNQFNEILFSTPLHKHGYFFGRFFAVLLLSTFPFFGAYVGLVLGSLLAPIFGWVDAENFGPFSVQTYINNYFIFILPNAFITGSILYSIASKWKNTVTSFLGVLGIISIFIVSSILMSDLSTQTYAAFMDIFGTNLYNVETQYYTALQKNTVYPTFTGLILKNRLLWMTLGAVTLLMSYRSFSFTSKNEKRKKEKKQGTKSEPIFALPALRIVFTNSTSWLQFKSFFLINFLNIIKSVTFKILLIFCFIILITSLSLGFETLGLQSYPLTYRIVDRINSNKNLFSFIILIFFSGELIWRDRDNKINEVIDATAHTSFISMIAKALSLVGTVSILHLVFIGIGIIFQLLSGFTQIELEVYFLDFLYDGFPKYMIFGGIMILIQVLLNQKYIAYFVSILVLFVSGLILAGLDISSNMLHIAGAPSIQYSDLNGFGPGLKGALWFNSYWILFSILSLLVAGYLWNRGVKNSLFKRFKIAKKQIPKSYSGGIIALIIVWTAVGGYVYYNTQILNPGFSNKTVQQLRADYEKKYKKHELLPSPKITAVTYYIDIFPAKQNVDARTVLTLTNENVEVINTLHFTVNEPFWDTEFKVPNSKLIEANEPLGYYSYDLKTPLQSGASMKVEIEAKYRTKGFQNTRGNTDIVGNGTMINYRSVMPHVGYNSRLEIGNNSTRKEYDLPERRRTPKLIKNGTKHHLENAISRGTSDFINVETVISTIADQIAIAPGSLVKQWEKEGRTYYRYKTDTSSLNYHTFNSGEYEVAKRKWKGIDIEVYHDKKHAVNTTMMLNAVERALKYYTTHFGPYYHKQCRIIEVPRYVRFGGQAFPGTMLYSEAAGFVMNLEDETKNNIVDAVIAHEMAHQWWAHQVIGANMQGNSMLSESLAEYSTLMTLKSIAKTPMEIREFLEYDHDMYLRGRSRESNKELPLYKVENQRYVRYGKGSIVLYGLQDFIGEERVNTALKGFLEAYRYKKAPYPSSLNFIEDFLEPQVPDSLNYLIKDWFKEITLYDNLLTNATYKKLENGKYSITLGIESHKIKADSIGNEAVVTMNDWIDVGFFLDNDETELYQQKRVKINRSTNTFTFELDTLPVKAAIDPRHIFIDKRYADNIKVLSEQE